MIEDLRPKHGSKMTAAGRAAIAAAQKARWAKVKAEKKAEQNNILCIQHLFGHRRKVNMFDRGGPVGPVAKSWASTLRVKIDVRHSFIRINIMRYI